MKRWLSIVALFILSSIGLAQSRLGQIRIPAPPAAPYVLHAIVPVRSYSGPVRVADLPSEGRVVGKARDWYYYEIHADVLEGSATTFDLLPGSGPTIVSGISPTVRAALLAPSAVTLEITDTQGTERFQMTGRPDSYFETGRLRATSRRNLDLGRFGSAQLWITAQAHRQQADFILNWHRGRIGDGDVLFRSARVLVAGRAVWRANLSDPAIGDGYLVKPITGNHILTQRSERSFRFSVHPDTVAYTVPWSNLGMADWSAGGVPPVGFGVPPVNGSDLDADTAAWRNALATLSPTPSGSTPVSFMWPAAGVTYRGMTGGFDMHPFDGVQWLHSGKASGFERYAIEQLRWRSRMRGCIYESDLEPVRPYEHLSATGTADWSMFDSLWDQSGGVPLCGPFIYPAQRLISQAAYNPEVFETVDNQHSVREWNHNALLVMAARDPLSLHYLRMEARKAVMTFWPGSGRASRLAIPSTPNMGSGFGRADAWAGMVVSHATVWASPAERLTYAPFTRKVIDHLRIAQMNSGLFQVNSAAKEGKNPPFCVPGTGTGRGDGTPMYLLGSGNEECYIAACIAALGGVNLYAFEHAPELLQRQAVGLRELGWAAGDAGVWSHGARGPWNSTTRYRTRADWPPALATGMTSGCVTCPYVDTYHVGYALAAMHQYGAPVEDLLMRFTRKATLTEAAAELRRWGLNGAGIPVDQWWPSKWVWAR